MPQSSDIPANSAEAEPVARKTRNAWELSPVHLLFVGFWAAILYLLSNSPLSDDQFWYQVAYGNTIINQGELPVGEPFAPPLFPTRLVDGSWLGQVILGQLAQAGGPEALSLVFAATTLISLLLLTRTFYLQSRHLLISHLALLAVVFIAWERISIARAELFGALCFSVLLWLLVRDRTSENEALSGRRTTNWVSWIGIAVLFAVWANVHESFLYGLLAVLCWWAGLVIEGFWQSRSIRGVLQNARVRRWTWLLELGLAASFLNPYGAGLLLHAIQLADYSRLTEVAGWKPLILLDSAGRSLILSLFAVILVWRYSRQRTAIANVLLLLAFCFVFASGTRNTWFYAAVLGVVLGPALSDLWRSIHRSRSKPSEDSGRNSRFGFLSVRKRSYALVAIAVIWIAFVTAPAGTWLVNGSPRPPEQVYGPTIPWRLTQYLKEQPPQRQTYNPHWWGGWLAWDGPDGLQLFMTPNVQLAPSKDWIDYRIVRETRSGWDNVLKRRSIETVVVDKYGQSTLSNYLRESEDWSIGYEDEMAVVFHRNPTEDN